MSVTSDELNYLIWRYLQESGHELSTFALQRETKAHLLDTQYSKHISIGALVSIVQKGIQYMEVEASIRDNGDQISEDKPFTLFGALHADDQEPKDYEISNSMTDDSKINGLIPNKDQNSLSSSNNGEFKNKPQKSENNPEILKETSVPPEDLMDIDGEDDVKSQVRLEEMNNHPNINSDLNNTLNNKLNLHDAKIQVQSITLPNPIFDLESIYNTGPSEAAQWSPSSPTSLVIAQSDSSATIFTFPSFSRDKNPNQSSLIEPSQTLKLTHSAIDYASEKEVTAVSWNSTGTLCATATFDGQMRIWTSNGKLRHNLLLHRAPVLVIKWNESNTLLLSVDCTNTVVIWDTYSGEVRQTFQHNVNSLSNIYTSTQIPYSTLPPSSSELPYDVANGGEHLSQQHQQPSQLQPQQEQQQSLQHEQPEHLQLQLQQEQQESQSQQSEQQDSTQLLQPLPQQPLQQSLKQKELLKQSQQQEPLQLQLQSQPQQQHQINQPQVNNISIGTDADWIDPLTYATTGESATIIIYKISERGPLFKFRGHTQGINSLQFNAKSQLLASGSDDHTIKIWSEKSSASIMTLSGHLSSVVVVRWLAPTGIVSALDPNAFGSARIASASLDGTVRIWDPSKGVCLAVLSLHESPIFACEVSPDGKFIASGGLDGVLIIWDVSTITDIEQSAVLASQEPQKKLDDFSGAIHAVARYELTDFKKSDLIKSDTAPQKIEPVTESSIENHSGSQQNSPNVLESTLSPRTDDSNGVNESTSEQKQSNQESYSNSASNSISESGKIKEKENEIAKHQHTNSDSQTQDHINSISWSCDLKMICVCYGEQSVVIDTSRIIK